MQSREISSPATKTKQLHHQHPSSSSFLHGVQTPLRTTAPAEIVSSAVNKKKGTSPTITTQAAAPTLQQQKQSNVIVDDQRDPAAVPPSQNKNVKTAKNEDLPRFQSPTTAFEEKRNFSPTHANPLTPGISISDTGKKLPFHQQHSQRAIHQNWSVKPSKSNAFNPPKPNQKTLKQIQLLAGQNRRKKEEVGDARHRQGEERGECRSTNASSHLVNLLGKYEMDEFAVSSKTILMNNHSKGDEGGVLFHRLRSKKLNSSDSPLHSTSSLIDGEGYPAGNDAVDRGEENNELDIDFSERKQRKNKKYFSSPALKERMQQEAEQKMREIHKLDKEEYVRAKNRVARREVFLYSDDPESKPILEEIQRRKMSEANNVGPNAIAHSIPASRAITCSPSLLRAVGTVVPVEHPTSQQQPINCLHPQSPVLSSSPLSFDATSHRFVFDDNTQHHQQTMMAKKFQQKSKAMQSEASIAQLESLSFHLQDFWICQANRDGIGMEFFCKANALNLNDFSRWLSGNLHHHQAAPTMPHQGGSKNPTTASQKLAAENEQKIRKAVCDYVGKRLLYGSWQPDSQTVLEPSSQPIVKNGQQGSSVMQAGLKRVTPLDSIKKMQQVTGMNNSKMVKAEFLQMGGPEQQNSKYNEDDDGESNITPPVGVSPSDLRGIWRITSCKDGLTVPKFCELFQVNNSLFQKWYHDYTDHSLEVEAIVKEYFKESKRLPKIFLDTLEATHGTLETFAASYKVRMADLLSWLSHQPQFDRHTVAQVWYYVMDEARKKQKRETDYSLHPPLMSRVVISRPEDCAADVKTCVLPRMQDPEKCSKRVKLDTYVLEKAIAEQRIVEEDNKSEERGNETKGSSKNHPSEKGVTKAATALVSLLRRGVIGAEHIPELKRQLMEKSKVRLGTD